MITKYHLMPVNGLDGKSLANTKYEYSYGKEKFIYARNSDGYRSEEFVKSPRFLFAGCSETFGESADFETTWAYKLFEKIKSPSDVYCNIGLPGIDVSLVIYHINLFIKKYGKPEFLFINFPQFSRVLRSDKVEVSTFTLTEKKDKKDLSDNVMEVDGQVLASIMSTAFLNIINFEHFCRQAGIKLIWTTWCQQSSLIVDYEGIASNYVDTADYELIADELIKYNTTKMTRPDNNHHGEAFHAAWAELLYKKYLETL